jgi:hypothetical protein
VRCVLNAAFCGRACFILGDEYQVLYIAFQILFLTLV